MTTIATVSTSSSAAPATTTTRRGCARAAGSAGRHSPVDVRRAPCQQLVSDAHDAGGADALAAALPWLTRAALARAVVIAPAARVPAGGAACAAFARGRDLRAAAPDCVRNGARTRKMLRAIRGAGARLGAAHVVANGEEPTTPRGTTTSTTSSASTHAIEDATRCRHHYRCSGSLPRRRPSTARPRGNDSRRSPSVRSACAKPGVRADSGGWEGTGGSDRHRQHRRASRMSPRRPADATA